MTNKTTESHGKNVNRALNRAQLLQAVAADRSQRLTIGDGSAVQTSRRSRPNGFDVALPQAEQKIKEQQLSLAASQGVPQVCPSFQERHQIIIPGELPNF